jgi:hypothetical protein
MATCPYCLSAVEKNSYVCHNCGAEKGYISLLSRVRGALFIVVWGILAPIILELILVLFVNSIIIFLVASFTFFAVILFSAYKLTSGTAWYR